MKQCCFKNFIGQFAVNLLLNFWGAIMSAVLLVLHFVLGIPLWFFWFGLIGWLVIIAAMTGLMTWVHHLPDVNDPPKVNKNPYSKK